MSRREMPLVRTVMSAGGALNHIEIYFWGYPTGLLIIGIWVSVSFYLTYSI
jgi:hypothetical protein